MVHFILAFLALTAPSGLATNVCTEKDDNSCVPVEPQPSMVTANSLVQRKMVVAEQELSDAETTARNDTGGHPRRYTGVDLTDAIKLVESPAGLLYFHAAKAMIQLCEYKVAAVQGLGSEGKDLYVNDEDVDSIIVHWCAAFTNITGHPCSAAEPFSEMVAGTRCVLEAAATKTGQPTVSEFASIMELFDTAEEDCMPPIIAELGTQGEGTATRCPGEFGSDATDAQEEHVEEENAREDVSNTSDGEDSHMSLAQTSSKTKAAVVVAQEIWRVSGGIQSLADSLHDGSVDDFQMQHVTSMWQETCATLGCDAESWKDIEDALHDHTAELIELNAPLAAIHGHIEAKGRARRAHMKIMNSKPVQDALQLAKSGNYSAAAADPIAFMTSRSARAGSGAMRYDPSFRHSSRVLHAIETMIQIASDQGVALTSATEIGELVSADSTTSVGWGGRRRRRRRRDPRRRRRRRGGFFGSVGNAVSSVATAVVHVATTVVTAIVDTFRCMSVSVGQTVGYNKQFSTSTSLGVKVTLEDSSNMADWIMGKSFAVCRTFKVHCTVGVAVGFKAAAGCSVGVSFSMQVAFDSCGSVQFDINVAVGGSCAWPSAACPYIPGFNALKIDCVEEVGAGLTIMCAKFNLKTGAYEGGR